MIIVHWRFDSSSYSDKSDGHASVRSSRGTDRPILRWIHLEHQSMHSILGVAYGLVSHGLREAYTHHFN
jgi:hypothetical protein